MNEDGFHDQDGADDDNDCDNHDEHAGEDDERGIVAPTKITVMPRRTITMAMVRMTTVEMIVMVSVLATAMFELQFVRARLWGDGEAVERVDAVVRGSG